jgi:GNAT superfamily N-acetyltransferase
MLASPLLLDIAVADYDDPADAIAVVSLLDEYARDPMGGGEPLGDDVRERLIPGLKATPGAFSVIARADGVAVGLANCLMSFSTFAAAPVVNIHDMVVTAAQRGKRVGRAMFAVIEAVARERGACKVTLEVLEGNVGACALYASLGYGDYVLDPKMGRALFWQKKLD